MNDLMVFVYFLCFAAVAGATFAYMYAMMNATLLDYNRFKRETKRTSRDVRCKIWRRTPSF